MRLQPRGAIAGIEGPIADCSEGLIGHPLDRFIHGKHSCGMSGLLLGRPVRGDPLRDGHFLLLMDR